jgi:hypothetical protein
MNFYGYYVRAPQSPELCDTHSLTLSAWTNTTSLP